METDDLPEPDDDFVESCVMRWGLPGAIIGLALFNAGLYFLWRYLLTLFTGA